MPLVLTQYVQRCCHVPGLQLLRQTGNTVLPDSEQFVVSNIGVALGLFLAGGWLTAQLSHFAGPRHMIWLITCDLFQTAVVFVAGAVRQVCGRQPGTSPS